MLLVLLFWNEVSSIRQGELGQVISGAATDPTPSDCTRVAGITRTWRKRAHMTSEARHTDNVTCTLLFWITHSLKCHEDITADPQTGPQARTAAVRAILQVALPAHGALAGLTPSSGDPEP